MGKLESLWDLRAQRRTCRGLATCGGYPQPWQVPWAPGLLTDLCL